MAVRRDFPLKPTLTEYYSYYCIIFCFPNMCIIRPHQPEIGQNTKSHAGSPQSLCDRKNNFDVFRCSSSLPYYIATSNNKVLHLRSTNNSSSIILCIYAAIILCHYLLLYELLCCILTITSISYFIHTQYYNREYYTTTTVSSIIIDAVSSIIIIDATTIPRINHEK